MQYQKLISSKKSKKQQEVTLNYRRWYKTLKQTNRQKIQNYNHILKSVISSSKEQSVVQRKLHSYTIDTTTAYSKYSTFITKAILREKGLVVRYVISSQKGSYNMPQLRSHNSTTNKTWAIKNDWNSKKALRKCLYSI